MRRLFLISFLVVELLLFGLGGAATAAKSHGATPVAIRIPAAKVTARVIPAAISSSGIPEEPSCPTSVYWYKDTGRLSVTGNVVMAGINEAHGGGPGVFAHLGELKAGDPIDVVGDNGKAYRFAVESVKAYPDRATAPVAEIFREAATEKVLTLFTGAGDLDAASNSYVGVLVVTARRTARQATVPATPIATPSTPAASCP